MELRSNIQSIFKPNEKAEKKVENLFDLSQNLDTSKLSNTSIKEIDSIENSLQFIHLDNHTKSQTERIHEMKSENEELNYLNVEKITNTNLWKEISISLKENDIIELRSNLNEIINSGNANITDFEIDQFIDADLSSTTMEDLDSLIKQNQKIASLVELHHEINNAIQENDITSLRSSIGSIIEEEQMISYSEIKRMDEYLLDYLDEKEHNEYEEKLSDDLRLRTETNLNTEINEALLENDIMNLRSSIYEIANENEKETKIRQFIPNTFKKSPSRMLGAAASIAAVISVGAISLSQQKSTANEIYSKVYKPYEATGLYRSASSLLPEVIGTDLYNKHKYLGALEQFNKVLKANPEHPMCNFYAGLSYQQLFEYKKAIIAYQNVIDEKDNLFIEQAEWYMALCLLKSNDQNKAFTTFNRIIDKNGYYSKDVKDLMKQLE
ncbi:MAG: tetratricopeptide repeat protein [Prolixibacteraceae bacterium]|jgi:hypothetical protein|nr:tetratricopeptide repeat protein [Prolixibacteraceae bacterium]